MKVVDQEISSIEPGNTSKKKKDYERWCGPIGGTTHWRLGSEKGNALIAHFSTRSRGACGSRKTYYERGRRRKKKGGCADPGCSYQDLSRLRTAQRRNHSKNRKKKETWKQSVDINARNLYTSVRIKEGGSGADHRSTWGNGREGSVKGAGKNHGEFLGGEAQDSEERRRMKGFFNSETGGDEELHPVREGKTMVFPTTVGVWRQGLPIIKGGGVEKERKQKVSKRL